MKAADKAAVKCLYFYYLFIKKSFSDMNLQSYSNESILKGIETHINMGANIPISHQLECKSRLESLHNDFLKLKEYLTEQYHIATSKYKNAKTVHDKKYHFGRLQIARNAIDMIETFNFVNSNCT